MVASVALISPYHEVKKTITLLLADPSNSKGGIYAIKLFFLAAPYYLEKISKSRLQILCSY